MHYRNRPEPTVCGGSNVTVLPSAGEVISSERNSSMKKKGNSHVAVCTGSTRYTRLNLTLTRPMAQLLRCAALRILHDTQRSVRSVPKPYPILLSRQTLFSI